MSKRSARRWPAGLIALRERNFVLYTVGQFTSQLGSWIELTAVSWIIYEMTNSPFLLGLVGLFRATPTILLALFGGAIADRVPRRLLLMCRPGAQTNWRRCQRGHLSGRRSVRREGRPPTGSVGCRTCRV